MKAHEREEVAWAAGLFEGEGSVTQSGGRLTLRLTNTDASVVEHFGRVMRLGRVYGPYRYEQRDGHRRKPFFVWVAQGDAARRAFDLLEPWLSRRRRDQMLAVLSGRQNT